MHAEELRRLSGEATRQTQAGDPDGARNTWQRALSLLPEGTAQYRGVQARIAGLGTHREARKTAWAKRLGPFAPLAGLLWKGKALLLGLTKISTLLSMFAFFGVYWALFGWPFALGFVLTIYIHEMGHVYVLGRYGIAATAPMFIPGFGAIIRMRQALHNVGEDARVGLAGPIWGLAAALAAELVFLATGAPVWKAIAHVAAWMNLFNLIPVWQLDGGRAFRALSKQDRTLALGACLIMWWITNDSILLFLAAGAAYRVFFARDLPEDSDRPVLIQYTGLVAVLSLLAMLAR